MTTIEWTVSGMIPNVGLATMGEKTQVTEDLARSLQAQGLCKIVKAKKEGIES